MKLVLLASLLVFVPSEGKDDLFKEYLQKNIDEYEGEKSGYNYEMVKAETNYGNIWGKRRTGGDNEEMTYFLGIPYAKPPVRDLRFKPPVAYDYYNDYKATKFGEKCIQSLAFAQIPDSILGAEDCLFLNVFTKNMNFNEPKPVMVWIHGGGFAIGSSQEYDPVHLVEEDVIVVTINYRLGAMGFLTFENNLAPGNNGIRDQIAALEWVHNYISYFGGDPYKVTIFGESAGGMSVHSLQMSPKARGLFYSAIQQSGNMLMKGDDFEKSQPRRVAYDLAEKYDFPSKYLDNDLLEHLQSIPAHTFVDDTDMEYAGFWWPHPDNYASDPVLPIDFLKAMMHGMFNKVPTMMGTMKNEGGIYMPPTEFEKFEQFLNSIAPFCTGKSANFSEFTKEDKMEYDIIYKYYVGEDRTDVMELFPDWAKIANDRMFLAPDQKNAEYISKYVPVYNYRFHFAGSPVLTQMMAKGSGKEAEYNANKAVFESMKPVHGDDIFYLFEWHNLETAEDKEMMQRMVKYWTNFAKYQNPTPAWENPEPKWRTYNYNEEKNYLMIDTQPEMKTEVEKERMHFWQKFFWDKRECERKSLGAWEAFGFY